MKNAMQVQHLMAVIRCQRVIVKREEEDPHSEDLASEAYRLECMYEELFDLVWEELAL